MVVVLVPMPQTDLLLAAVAVVGVGRALFGVGGWVVEYRIVDRGGGWSGWVGGWVW